MRRDLFDRLRGFFGSSQSELATRPQVIWSGDSSFGECPVWRRQSNAVYWVDIPSGMLRAYSCATGEVKTWAMGEGSAGLAMCKNDNSLIIGRSGLLRSFNPETAELQLFATLPEHQADERTNDLAFDASGGLWVTTMHTAGERPLGRLLRRSADGQWMTAFSGVPILNGPAFDDVRQVGYFCDSVRRCVLRFAIPSPDATACEVPCLFASLTEAEGYPDGLTVDAHGNVWLAHYGGARVSCYAPDGTVRSTMQMPVRHVTSVAIGGGMLFITTARDTSDPNDACGGSLYSVMLDSL